MKCVNCKGEKFENSTQYPGFHQCVDCKFQIDLKGKFDKVDIIVADDPMDAMLCESCQ